MGSRGRRLGGVCPTGARLRVPGAQTPHRRCDARGGATLMAGIEVTGLHKRYPDGTVAVDHVDLSIKDGELFVMLGPSGCGKTTTLRAIAGLERQTTGDIRIGDTLVNDLPPAERDNVAAHRTERGDVGDLVDLTAGRVAAAVTGVAA
ncbi:ATP-binding cassette domain-containing protein, partial [Micromonospora sp. NPDC002411]